MTNDKAVHPGIIVASYRRCSVNDILLRRDSVTAYRCLLTQGTNEVTSRPPRLPKSLRHPARGHLAEARTRLVGQTHPSRLDRRAPVQRRVLERQAVRCQAWQCGPPAVATTRVATRGGGSDRLWHRRTGDWPRRKRATHARDPGGAQLLPHGVQRGRQSENYRRFHSVPGTRVRALRGRAQKAGARQPQGCRHQGGLVRPGSQPKTTIIL
jgi:hypothetical protein